MKCFVFGTLLIRSRGLSFIYTPLRTQAPPPTDDAMWWGADACLRCQAESKKDFYGRQDCVVVWGECNHSFHYCCMSLWVKQNNRCPLCQQEWSIQRMGK
ncbi:RING-box protein 2 isoform X2 [Cephus cinctus]|uniref:RING-box protein 2 isoform X2 n=1 Tax=Cephus cinctus TaxID=211228 RepID=A0AAJ7BIZ1_CEPCN|nr:RING-box protein 2 isoform X2 [Cephus cinctus]